MASDVRSVYRALLRVRRRAFAGDSHALAAAATQIRAEFDKNRHVADEKSLAGLIAQAREAVDFIALNVVQAKLNQRGNYEVKLEKEHTGKIAESADEVVVPKSQVKAGDSAA